MMKGRATRALPNHRYLRPLHQQLRLGGQDGSLRGQSGTDQGNIASADVTPSLSGAVMQ